EPEARSIPIALRPARARVRARPLGTVGIIGHWAQPFYTLLAPLVGAIAAGNCVVLKPSMRPPKTAKLLGTILPEYLNPRSIVTVTGGEDALEQLPSQPFDLLFYSGSTEIGPRICHLADAQLPPDTLQLSGKSSVIVADGRDWKTIGRRIAYGKFGYAGQNLTSPDYLIAVGYY